MANVEPDKYSNKRQRIEGSSSDKVIDIARYTLSDFELTVVMKNASRHNHFIFMLTLFDFIASALTLTLRTPQNNNLKIMTLHGRIFMLFSQFIFSILTRFQRAHKKGILIFRYFFKRSFNFFLLVCLYLKKNFAE